MAILVILAIGLLVPAAAAVLAQRRSLATKLADIRGVALQTVIVIVVMLVIAGAVAGVLLTRGGEVVSDLEGQEVGPVTADNCAIVEVVNLTGSTAALSGWCIWVNNGQGTGDSAVTRASCIVIGGHYGVASAADTVTLGGTARTLGTGTAAKDDAVCGVDLNA